ncbi:MAG TPA: hypothetical protein ENI11_03880 [Actinobacteria bacterium]|nr:hypothetical protein [Actinomycetota bacterium]
MNALFGSFDPLDCCPRIYFAAILFWILIPTYVWKQTLWSKRIKRGVVGFSLVIIFLLSILAILNTLL